MKAFAAKHGFTFPYVIDETQEVARAYDAQCTPDFFGLNAQDELQYRGRLDASPCFSEPQSRTFGWRRLGRPSGQARLDSWKGPPKH
jgi:hypothetical protein